MPKVNSESSGAQRSNYRPQSPSNEWNRVQFRLEMAQLDIRTWKLMNQMLEGSLSELQERYTTVEEELSVARHLLDGTISELKTSQASNRSHTEKITELERCLEKKEQEKQDLKSEFQVAEDIFKREAALRADRLMATERQLYRAQRHIKFFDQMSSFQHEIRTGSDYDFIRRCKNYSPSSDCSKVIKLVKCLNVAILQFAKSLSKEANCPFHFENGPTAANDRVEALLGKPMMSILRSKAFHWQFCDVRTLMNIVLRMFLVAWCLAIIEGWYPKRQNFLDLLIKLNQSQEYPQEVLLTQTEIIPKSACLAKTEIITKSANADYHAWADDILLDLSAVLEVGGIEMDCKGLSQDLIPILKKAYNIRTALAEKDLYGNIEVCTVTLCAPFQPNCMKARYRGYDSLVGTPSSRPSEPDYVIGNVSLGLEVNETGGGNEGLSTTRAILDPLVVVSTSIDFSPNNLTYSCISL